jgi:hypothetical protein
VANRTFYLSSDNPQEVKNLGIYYKRSVLVAMQEFGTTWEVKFTQKKPPKSLQQCRGWHRILGLICDLLNENKVDNKIWELNHVKHYVKHAIQFGDFMNGVFIPRSFANASKDEAAEVIVHTQMFAIEQLGMNASEVELLNDDEQAFEKYYDKYK